MSRLTVAVPLVAVLLAAGCAAGPTPAGTPAPAVTTGPATAALPSPSGIDLIFLNMMAAHTEQTLEIVRSTRGRIADQELRTLVAAIAATETDELATMRAWLAAADPVSDRSRHDHSGHGVSATELARLRNATAGEVDTVLREVLAEHQRSAADLARAQLAAGTDERVRDLARRIEQSRTAEVRLLTGTPAGVG
ncbi:DUF305 domain-containing protein [Micromonospora sp. 15K316]|uniref:DUF305 domain-containing protein n=1 Tax=Micromonospora sp. 15K316 TaxID=2530376 RepID=UPI0010486EC5|nr:DUF305 domain-containing protein [Micromonospora sp. 15K316]TDC32659.1 DUF305 domain-containing protein [Micromonospora sp. 15K316]